MEKVWQAILCYSHSRYRRKIVRSCTGVEFIEHADGYRNHRSPIAGDSPGTRLVVEIGNQTSYTDTGSTTDTTKTPLPTGALGAGNTTKYDLLGKVLVLYTGPCS